MNETTAPTTSTTAAAGSNPVSDMVAGGFDLETELLEVALLADFLSVAAEGGDSEAHSGLSYAARRLADHRDRLHRAFEAMQAAHYGELDALRAKVTAARDAAAPGSTREAERLDATRAVLLAAAETMARSLREMAP